VAIADADIRRVRDATDLVALISETVALRRVGRRWVGLCPFHDERTPSFSVNPELGVYYCFGCHARGDAITFLREHAGLDFQEAVEQLAARAGIRLDVEAQAPSSSPRRQSLELLAAQARWYQAQLVSAQGAGARRYLAERGIDDEAVERFAIGWAPPGRVASLSELGGTADLALEVGIRVRGGDGVLHDPMSARVVFPIRDTAGQVIGFGGRALPPLREGVPKYRNTQDTPLYHKRQVLYNLDRARSAFLRERRALVCEGYTDVIALDRAGIAAVATCGTALTEDHLRVLRRFAPQVVVIFDGDEAGQRAAAQAAEVAEAAEVELLVATLPDGLDPADAAARDPALVSEALAGAVPVARFCLERVLAGADLRSPEGRARAVTEAAGVIGAVRDPLVRSEYVALLADRTGFREAELAARLPAALRPRHLRRALGEALDRPAAAVLLALAVDPELGDLVVPALFRDPAYRELARALGEREGREVADVLVGLSEEVRELYHRIAASDVEADLEGALVVLVMREADLELKRIAHHLDALPPADHARWLAAWTERVQQLHRLRIEPTNLEIAGSLLDFLVDVREHAAEGAPA